jgi:CheY-like chemotaxis protein
VAQKIMLADDSLTAQKFGKEILVGAGYEVTAVSNGAAAAKKLAEDCDLYIFDMIMPGYTGLELCEKVRSAPDLAKRPVLLTVGQMEHYDQNDVQRVRADGVIVKPFIKSDLEAIVSKMLAQSAAAPAAQPEYEKTMIFQAPQVEEFKDDTYAAWKSEAQEEMEPPAPPPMEIPQDMAAAPAFFDSEEPAPPPPPPEAPKKKFDPDETVSPTNPFDETIGFPPPRPKQAEAPAVDFGMEFPPVAPVMEVTQVEAQSFETLLATTAAPELAVESHRAADAGPVIAGSAPDVEFTAAPKVGDIAVAKESGLEAIETETGEPVVHKDPSLVTDPSEMAKEFTTKFGVEGEEMPFEAPIKGFERPPIEEVLPPAAAKAEVDDFEARVAAAMSSYEEPVEEAAAPAVEATAPTVEDTQPMEAVTEAAPMVEETAPEPVIPEEQRPPEGMVDAALVEQMQAAFADLPVEPHPPEEAPAVEAAPVAPAPAGEAAAAGPDADLAKELAASVGAATPIAGMDTAMIAQAVSKVMERMMPTLLAEVSKEIEAARKQ